LFVVVEQIFHDRQDYRIPGSVAWFTMHSGQTLFA
jgi:hypothetical protein